MVFAFALAATIGITASIYVVRGSKAVLAVPVTFNDLKFFRHVHSFELKTFSDVVASITQAAIFRFTLGRTGLPSCFEW